MTHNNMGSHIMHTPQVMNITTSMMPIATNSVNGISANKVDRKFWQTSSGKNNISSRDYGTENKSTISEKLKILLENGSSSDKLDDPYAFQDVEQCLDKFKVTGSNNIGTVTRIISEQMPFIDGSRSKTITDQINSETKSVPAIYLNTNHMTFAQSPSSRFNVTASDILPRHPAEAAKVKSPLLKTAKTPTLPANSRSVQNLVAKGQNLKSANVSPSNRSTGKPFNFGKSQMSKLAIAKIEKTLENRSKTVGKGASTSLYKTASICKYLPKQKRSAPTRSFSVDSDSTVKSETVKPKVVASKSLLEESLLGLKPIAVEKTWAAGSSWETASPTVYVPLHPNSRSKSLERVWEMRNKIKLLKRDYKQYGLLIGEAEVENHDVDSDIVLFQNYWFSLCNDYDSFAGHNRKREAKLARLKTELRHKLKQQQWRYKDDYREKMAQLFIKTAREMPNFADFLVRLEASSLIIKNKVDRLSSMQGAACKFMENGKTSACGSCSLPNASYCAAHIMHHSSQILFSPCTVTLQPENQPCGGPALGKSAGLALCSRHSRIQIAPQNKPKLPTEEKQNGKNGLPGKRNRSSLGSSRSGRSRKRKRQSAKDKKDPRDETMRGPVVYGAVNASNILANSAFIVSKCEIDEAQEVEIGDDGIVTSTAELPLDTVEQATRLLEEHDFTNVLNHIPADAFNDLFTEDKEEYEPTLQETEELERALEAVDNDVKSLEKLTETQGLLDMLDEQSIAQTLAALPEVVPALYHNGFTEISPLEQTICENLPNALLISQHADILQS